MRQTHLPYFWRGDPARRPALASGKPDAHELPARLGRKKIAIRRADVRLGRGTRASAQNVLVAHEFPVVFADARRRCAIARDRVRRRCGSIPKRRRTFATAGRSAVVRAPCERMERLAFLKVADYRHRCAAPHTSHSASVGRRAPAQRAKASASKKLTCVNRRMRIDLDAPVQRERRARRALPRPIERRMPVLRSGTASQPSDSHSSGRRYPPSSMNAANSLLVTGSEASSNGATVRSMSRPLVVERETGAVVTELLQTSGIGQPASRARIDRCQRPGPRKDGSSGLRDSRCLTSVRISS